MRQWQQQHQRRTEAVTCSSRCCHEVADAAALRRTAVEWLRSCWLGSAVGERYASYLALADCLSGERDLEPGQTQDLG